MKNWRRRRYYLPAYLIGAVRMAREGRLDPSGSLYRCLMGFLDWQPGWIGTTEGLPEIVSEVLDEIGAAVPSRLAEIDRLRSRLGGNGS